MEFGGGRLTGRIEGGPGRSGIARITATAENGAADHSFFAWMVAGTPTITKGAGTRDNPHRIDGQGKIADIRDWLRDGVTNGDDTTIPTWFQVTVPANSIMEFAVANPEGQDFDMIHDGVHYDSGAPRETIRLENPTDAAATEMVAVYRYAPETDGSIINTNSEGGVSHPPVPVTFAHAMPGGADLFDQWNDQDRGAVAQAVTGEFVAEMAVFHAPANGDGATVVHRTNHHGGVANRGFFG